MFHVRTWIIIILFFACIEAQAGVFIEQFEDGEMLYDPAAVNGGAWQSGDGEAIINFSQADGIGKITVDARADKRNTWWALIRHSISDDIDMQALTRPDREMRVEAKVRTDTTPCRLNLHFNHSQTTVYHSHLMDDYEPCLTLPPQGILNDAK